MKTDLRIFDSVAKLIRAAPQRFRQLLEQAKLPDANYQLVSFGSERKVILSGHVHKALERCPADPNVRIVALGGTFTAEAAALLRERGAVIRELHEFHWTDESYQRIRRPPDA